MKVGPLYEFDVSSVTVAASTTRSELAELPVIAPLTSKEPDENARTEPFFDKPPVSTTVPLPVFLRVPVSAVTVIAFEASIFGAIVGGERFKNQSRSRVELDGSRA